MYILIAGCSTASLIPQRLNTTMDEDGEDSPRDSIAKVTWKDLIYNKTAAIALLANTIAFILESFMDPILAVHLTQKGIQEQQVGYIFGVIGFSQVIGSPIAGWLCSRLTGSLVMQIGLFASAVAIAMGGPSQILGLPDSLAFILVGMSLIGFFNAFIIVPVTSQVIRSVYAKAYVGLRA